VSSRTAKAIQRNPVSKNQTKKKKKKKKEGEGEGEGEREGEGEKEIIRYPDKLVLRYLGLLISRK
jgi:ribosomal protein L19E